MPKDPPNVSVISTRVPNPEFFNLKRRQQSQLPFVSWEDGRLHRMEVEFFDSLDYPFAPPAGEPGLAEDQEQQALAMKTAIERLLASGAADALHLKPEHLVEKCLAAKVHPRAHLGLTRLFFSWAADSAKLFDLARFDLPVTASELQHLVEPTDCELRFSQGGDGLLGAHPRHVAWRSWRNFEFEQVSIHDLLMDLQSFAWYSLQHEVRYEHVLLGGSARRANRASLVYAARKQSGTGWLIDTLPADHTDFSDLAVVIMS